MQQLQLILSIAKVGQSTVNGRAVRMIDNCSRCHCEMRLQEANFEMAMALGQELSAYFCAFPKV